MLKETFICDSCSIGFAQAVSTAMIAVSTINSITVKPRWFNWLLPIVLMERITELNSMNQKNLDGPRPHARIEHAREPIAWQA